MKKTLDEIAKLASGEAVGNPKIAIKNVANIDEASSDDLTFAMDEKAVEKFESSNASAAVVPKNLKKFPKKPHIKVPDVRIAMIKILSLFDAKKTIQPGVHKSAVTGKNLKIGSGSSVMAFSVIGENVEIGSRAKIYPGSYIGDGCVLGNDVTIHPNAVLYERTVIGNRCVVHSGAVLGVDGFGFAPVNGKYEKIPQIGNVVLEDDVEIFANTCISRATMGSTIIKRGSKIDNLTHIAHNCRVGEDCAITALVAVAGSTELGNHVSIGGTSGINDHIKVGDNTVIMGRSGVTKNIPPNSVISGFPAQDHKKEMELQASLRRLPRLIEKVAEIEKNTSKK